MNANTSPFMDTLQSEWNELRGVYAGWGAIASLVFALLVGVGAGGGTLYYYGTLQLERHAEQIADLFQQKWVGTAEDPIPKYSRIRKEVVLYNRKAPLFKIAELRGTLPDGSWEVLYDGRDDGDIIQYASSRYQFRLLSRTSLGWFDYVLYGATRKALFLAFLIGGGGFILVVSVGMKGVEKAPASSDVPAPQLRTEEIIQNEVSEGKQLDYKAVFHWNRYTNQRFDTDKQHRVLKNIASFLNTEGGVVLIGVNDDIEPITVDGDVFDDLGEARWHLGNAMNRMAPNPMDGGYIRDIRYDVVDGHRILRIDCQPSDRPVFLTDKRSHDFPERKVFYVRRGESSEELEGEEMMDYIRSRFRWWALRGG